MFISERLKKNKTKQNSSEIWMNATRHPKFFHTLRQLLNELKLQVKTNILLEPHHPELTIMNFRYSPFSQLHMHICRKKEIILEQWDHITHVTFDK